MNKELFKQNITKYCKVKYGKKIEDALAYEAFNAVSLALLEEIVDDWSATTENYNKILDLHGVLIK